MRALVPHSRTGHNPLEGREWEGHSCGDYISLDGYLYKFHRYDRYTMQVEVSEAMTGILWQYPKEYFNECVVLHGRQERAWTEGDHYP